MFRKSLILVLFLSIIIFVIVSCDDSTQPPQTFTPTVTTLEISNITSSSATTGGNITSNGGSDITARGVCWNTNSNPTIADNKTNDGSGSGSFTSVIIGLLSSTTFYVRAYATNSAGTGYGDTVSFRTDTASQNIVTDIDGNVYHTVTIGTQTWLLENLKTSRYSNGDPIEHVIDNSQWSNTTFGAYCNYDNNPDYTNTYGRLYNWATVNDSRKIAPTGWHVATKAEWDTMVIYLGGLNVAGGKLKEAGTAHWWSPNNGATNESGFTALPGGYRTADGTFLALGAGGVWWTSSSFDGVNAFSWHLDYNYFWILSGTTNKKEGINVRCIKN